MATMRISITGNLGYLGPCVVSQLRMSHPSACLTGVDTAYFAGCLTDPLLTPERQLDRQYFTDVRDIPAEAFNGVDAVVHLAGISNDPIGNRFERATQEVNFEASIELARRARQAGARSFVFASSCSVYGSAEEAPRTEQSAINPLTAYARSKVATECGLRSFAGGDFTVTCLRFATACGMSPRLRLDLVLNDFVASAVSTGQIRVLSNGTPWRPLIHVRDMARAIDWAITRRPANGGGFLVVNAGSNAWTYQVKDLAAAVAESIPGATISINRGAPDDKRSYKVDFGLFRRLAPGHQPQEQLGGTIRELRESLSSLFGKAIEPDRSRFIRLRVLSELLERGWLNEDLRWVGTPIQPVPADVLDSDGAEPECVAV